MTSDRHHTYKRGDWVHLLAGVHIGRRARVIGSDGAVLLLQIHDISRPPFRIEVTKVRPALSRISDV